MVWSPTVIPLDKCTPQRLGDLHYAWSYGDLRYKLDPHQIEVYLDIKGKLPRVNSAASRRYVLQWGRQTGKDWLLGVIALETAIRNPGMDVRYGAPTQDMIIEIVTPTIEQLLIDCPESLKPTYEKGKHQYHFPSGSTIHLVGCDLYPDRMRGSNSILVLLTEAGFFQNLSNVVEAILPQLITLDDRLGKPVAHQIFASTPPISPLSHDFTTKYKAQAKADGLYNHSTVYDNPRITRETADAFINELGGPESVAARRELLAEDITDTERMIIPEWIKMRKMLIRDNWVTPSNYHAYLSVDPGQTATDRHAHLYAYYDFRNNKIVFTKAYTLLSPKTSEVAKHIQLDENELWHCGFWDGEVIQKNPYKRVSDTQLQLINDLTNDYGFEMVATDKHELLATVQKFRDWINNGDCIFLPGTEELQLQLDAGIWHDKNRKKFAHVSESLGHFDLIAAAVYLVRNVDTQLNPYPPAMQPGIQYKDSHNPYYDYVPQSGIKDVWTS